jgi:integrase
MGSRYSMTLKRDAKSAAWKDRIRLVPEDVRLEYQALYGPGWEEKFHRAADTPPDKSRAEHAAWAAKVRQRIAALRASKGSKGIDLTQRQADALAGDWYRWFTSQRLDNPGDAKRWSALREVLWDLAETAGDPEIREADFDDPEVLGVTETEAKASQFLTDGGIALTQAGRTRFLSALVREFLAATKTLERRARGDWGPDRHLDQLAPSPNLSPATSPSPNGQRREAATGGRPNRTQLPSAVALFDAYIKDKQVAASTIDGWRCVFTALDALPVQEAVTDQRGAQRWLDGLVGAGTPPRKHRTVRDTWLAAARAVFRWGVRHGRVEVNPFEGCVVEVPRQSSTRETGKAFTDEEALTILSAALRVEAPRRDSRGAHWAATRRWVPWLCAYTGARVRELTQLRAQDIEQRTCGPVLRITPEAGTQKSGKVRAVPIHPHLVEMGLLDYVAAVEARLGKKGPLFYRPQTRPSRKPPAVKARERLAEWVRGLGVTDPGIQPNHAWRHTFRTRASRAGIEKRIRDEICGHAPGTVADKYEHPTIEDMTVALKRFPRYEVE